MPSEGLSSALVKFNIGDSGVTGTMPATSLCALSSLDYAAFNDHPGLTGGFPSCLFTKQGMKEVHGIGGKCLQRDFRVRWLNLTSVSAV